MIRILYLTIAVVLAVFYYYFVGAGPGPSELPEDLEWWRPQGWLLRWDAMLQLAELADAEGPERLIPVYLFWIPPAALLASGLYLFKAALARSFVVWLSLMLAAIAYYGIEAARVWRFFEWRFTAVSASLIAIITACLFAPSLLRALLRIPRAITAVLLLGLFAGIFLLQTEITGTDANMRFNISPWPVITVFGMLYFGYTIAAFHLAAGAGLWLASRRPGALGAAGGAVLAAGLAGLGCAWIFSDAEPARIATFAGIGGAYTLLAHALLRDTEPPLSPATARIAAGLLVVAMIGISNGVAVSNQIRARDDTAKQVLLALEEFKKANAEYPDRLRQLVPDYLAEIPRPLIGLIRNEDDEFDYSSFGDSYALEFASVQWVQCAYSPPYEFAAYDEDEEEDAEDDTADAEGSGEEGVDVAAPAPSDDERAATARLREAGLEGSWNCPKEPPKIW